MENPAVDEGINIRFPPPRVSIPAGPRASQLRPRHADRCCCDPFNWGNSLKQYPTLVHLYNVYSAIVFDENGGPEAHLGNHGWRAFRKETVQPRGD